MVKSTKTSSFGISERVNHDSTIFYASKMYNGYDLPKKINYVCEEFLMNILIKYIVNQVKAWMKYQIIV